MELDTSLYLEHSKTSLLILDPTPSSWESLALIPTQSIDLGSNCLRSNTHQRVEEARKH